ncbi:MAG: sodium:solute symporter family protein [Bacteroidota bacterium]
MTLEWIDGLIIIAFFALSIGIGIWVSRKGNKDSKDYFLAGGNMPWWLLGVSMVATTFSTDTPNLVTEIVRTNGVSGNWTWWAFLLTGMLTVFIYARLWKKSGVMTDIEFYELRYSGSEARFLRGFRAIYLGVFFNVVIMASVTLAAIKIGGVLLGLSPVETVLIAGVVTVIYSSLGGLKGVIFTDFVQFFLSMGGALAAAVISLNHPKVGGLSNLISDPRVIDKMAFVPDFDSPELYLSIFLVPLLVQWWNVWYPGAEPGGGGYIAQRMLSAKNEENAVKSVLFFNIAHYAIRPWPWIIVAFCSMLVFPDLQSIQDAFPNVKEVKDDLAYPAMLTFLPTGVLGLVVTSLIAAYMSTISTHLNWGASYISKDFYKRFVNKQADERKLVAVGRISTIGLMALSMIFALLLDSALDSFNILLQIGAGTGLIFILRWFWWRVNALSEIVAMFVSFLVAIFFNLVMTEKNGFEKLEGYQELLIGIAITTIAWLATAYFSQPTDRKVLEDFVRKVNPGGVGWKAVTTQMDQPPVQTKTNIGYAVMGMLLSTVAIYSTMISTGLFIYGRSTQGAVILTLAVLSGFVVSKIWHKMPWSNSES